MDKFTVYLMTCGLGRYKIGFTARTAEKRAQELSKRYKRPYAILATVHVNGDKLDGLIMERLTQGLFRASDKVEYDEHTEDHFDTLLNRTEAQELFTEAVKNAYTILRSF